MSTISAPRFHAVGPRPVDPQASKEGGLGQDVVPPPGRERPIAVGPAASAPRRRPDRRRGAVPGRRRGPQPALHCKDWRRRPEEWSPSEDNPIPLFSSLAHHLLADYPVPPVLLSPWFRARSPETWRQQDWFIHLGRGGSLRTAGLPIPITRRIAHEFAQAPPQFRVEYAIRWAQVLGLGGTESLAHALARSELGRSFHVEQFWVTVFHFFINNPGIPSATSTPSSIISPCRSSRHASR